MCFNISIAKEKKSIEQRSSAKFSSGLFFSTQYFLKAFNYPKVPAIPNDKLGVIQLFNWGLIPHWVNNNVQPKHNSSKTFNY